MIYRLLCFNILISLTFCLHAKQNTEDVIYLKNGGVIRGKIIENTGANEQNGSGKVKIELAGGSIFVFSNTEIDSIRKENALKNRIRELNKNYFRKNQGYRNITEEIALIYGTTLTNNQVTYNNNGQDDVGLSLHSINGYQFWPTLFVGGGVGIDRFISYQETFSPFYLRLASEFLKKKVTPYVYADAGYGVMWQTSYDHNYYSYYKNKGGFYCAAGGGVRVYTHSRASVMFSIGYKQTNSETDWV